MNSLFQFLNNGLSQSMPIMGQEKELIYSSYKIPGIFNERSHKTEIDFSGRTQKKETSFLIQNEELTRRYITINKNSKATIDDVEYKIDDLIEGPVTTTLMLGLVNSAQLPT